MRNRSVPIEWLSAFLFIGAVAFFAGHQWQSTRHKATLIPILDVARGFSTCVAANQGRVKLACTREAQALSDRLYNFRKSDLPFTPRLSHFNIFVVGNSLVYRRKPCADDDVPETITLNIYAKHASVLPEDRRSAGFISDDFKFDAHGMRIDGACVALKELPSWAVEKVMTGEYIRGQGFRWSLAMQF